MQKLAMVVSARSVWHLASVEEGVGATAGDNEGLGASGAGVLRGTVDLSKRVHQTAGFFKMSQLEKWVFFPLDLINLEFHWHMYKYI